MWATGTYTQRLELVLGEESLSALGCRGLGGAVGGVTRHLETPPPGQLPSAEWPPLFLCSGGLPHSQQRKISSSFFSSPLTTLASPGSPLPCAMSCQGYFFSCPPPCWVGTPHLASWGVKTGEGEGKELFLLVCLGPCTLPGVTMPWASPGVSRCAACQTLWGERKGSQALGEASNSAVTTAGLSLRSRILVPSWTRSAYHFSWPPVQLTILSLLLSFSHETTQVS